LLGVETAAQRWQVAPIARETTLQESKRVFSLRSGETCSSEADGSKYFLADFNRFDVAIAKRNRVRRRCGKNQLSHLFTGESSSSKLTGFLRGRPLSEPDWRMPEDVGAQREGTEEVPCIAGTHVLNVCTLAGKLVLKSNAADLLVRDLMEDLSVKLNKPSQQQLHLLSGGHSLEMGVALRPLLVEGRCVELCVVIDANKAGLVQDRIEIDEPIPEDARNEGHHYELVVRKALEIRQQARFAKMKRQRC